MIATIRAGIANEDDLDAPDLNASERTELFLTKITTRLSECFSLGLAGSTPVGRNEMKLDRAVISVCTLVSSVVFAAAQSVAAERPSEASPDTTVLEKAIKEKLESANPEARPLSPSKAPQSRSFSKVESAGSFRHRARPQPKSPSNVKALSSLSHIKSKSASSFKHLVHHGSKFSSNPKVLASGSHSRTQQIPRSHRHRSSRAGEQPLEVPVPIVIVPMQEVLVPVVIVPITSGW